MARSLSLSAYRLLSRRSRHSGATERPERPAGRIVWFHATTPARIAVARDIAAKLRSQRGGLRTLLTVGDGTSPPEEKGGFDWTDTLGGDHPEAASACLSHWRPDLGVWIGGRLMHNALAAARNQKIPMILADADLADLPGAGGWRAALARESLTVFDRAFAVGEGAAARLDALGIAPDRVTRTPPLVISGTALPVNEDAIADLTEMLAGRPVWLAAEVHPDEVAQVLAAHLSAARLSHRLLLVLTPSQAGSVKDLVEQARGMGLRVADWDAGDLPDELTQVLVAPGGRHLGLWYRVAPVAFIGCSLVAGQGGRDPFDAAAMGSAVLYGPNVRDHLAAYSRLAAGGAARIVKDADGLAAAVMQTLAPDRAAAMALAGWEIVSEGAASTDQLIDAIQDRLDRVGRR